MINKCSIQEVWVRILIALTFTTMIISVVTYVLTGQWTAVIACMVTASVLFIGMSLGVKIFHQKLALFTEGICTQIDDMMAGKEIRKCLYDEDTLFDRIVFKLSRLYDSLQTAKTQISSERAELQSLISDVAHQIKTPATNLRLAVGALSEQELSRTDQEEYLQILTSQVEKLDFLMSAMVKSSRLESGAITLVKTPSILYETLAAAVSGIYLAAQEKQMKVTVSGPEDLQIPHDSKWTTEALFNILDNAVKYTPCGGSISISIIHWEAYTKIDIADNGRGIEESKQASIFGRFYREAEVHETQGLGLGLYLAREIISKQGGYIKVFSNPGQGSVFSVFLPNKESWKRRDSCDISNV